MTKEALRMLPLSSFSGKIEVVTEEPQVPQALAKLSRETVIGFDTETRPTFSKGVVHPVSLLQLAGRDKAFLFRLRHIGLPSMLVSWLENPEITKVGVAIHDDLKALQKLNHFEPRGFLDLSDVARELGIVTCGLRNLAATFLGVRISKRAQLTNWDRPTLDKHQKTYAATDAWVCLEMYLQLQRGGLWPPPAEEQKYQSMEEPEEHARKRMDTA